MAHLYQPLYYVSSLSQDLTEPGDWALRLVTLFPGVEDSPIVCRLDHSTLNQSQCQYEALSYVWGEPALSCPIIINGHQGAVTQNLAHSLHHLRRASEPRIFWIDALCINQWDVQERSQQVQRMGPIYEHASRVVVFLGIEAKDSSKAMSLLTFMSRLAPDDHEGIDALLNNDTLAESWQALLQMLRRPWWSRAWIVQEYAVGTEVVFVCGMDEVDGQVFTRALENLVDYRFKAMVPRKHEYLIRHVANTRIHHLWSTRREYRDTQRRSNLHSLDVLYKFRGSECSDPRDKVFSIFNLTKQDRLLTPDLHRAQRKFTRQ